jgi:hypothetical protein
MTEKLRPAKSGDGSQIVASIRNAAATPAIGPIAITNAILSAPIMRGASGAADTMPTPKVANVRPTQGALRAGSTGNPTVFSE